MLGFDGDPARPADVDLDFTIDGAVAAAPTPKGAEVDETVE